MNIIYGHKINEKFKGEDLFNCEDPLFYDENGGVYLGIEVSENTGVDNKEFFYDIEKKFIKKMDNLTYCLMNEEAEDLFDELDQIQPDFHKINKCKTSL